MDMSVLHNVVRKTIVADTLQNCTTRILESSPPAPHLSFFREDGVGSCDLQMARPSLSPRVVCALYTSIVSCTVARTAL